MIDPINGDALYENSNSNGCLIDTWFTFEDNDNIYTRNQHID